MSMLLALAGITIGLGALYYGLPQARYRGKLLDNIKAALAIQEVSLDISDELRAQVHKKMVQDGAMSGLYYRIATWIRELPTAAQDDLRETLADLFSEVSNPPDTPRLFRYFKSDSDKRTSLFLSVALPILVLWVFYWLPCLVECSWTTTIYSSLLFFAQLWIVGNMIVGVWMVSTYTTNFRKDLRAFISGLGIEASDEMVRNSTIGHRK